MTLQIYNIIFYCASFLVKKYKIIFSRIFAKKFGSSDFFLIFVLLTN